MHRFFFLCFVCCVYQAIFELSNTHFYSVCYVMSSYADNWASTPWQAPEPLEAVQHLRSLLCTTEGDTSDQNVPSKVCTVVGGILDNIEEKIKTHCKYKHLIHVEHQVDASSGRDLVRIWKCTEVQHYTDFGYDPHSCPEGAYYDWQKIDVRSASESQEVNNKVQEIMSTVRETFPRHVEDLERTRSRSPRGEASQPNTLQAPFFPSV